MAEAQLRQQIESLQVQLANLQTQINAGRPTAPKDLSLVSLIPKWAGTEKCMSAHEFFETVENTAKVGNWGPTDKIQIVVLKLTEVAKAFYNSNLELHANDITWENFKGKFLHRFRDVRNEQYHFIKLQTARQRADETPQEFADRCRSLALKTVPKVDNPELQKFHFQQAERMLLSTFIAGLIGNAGQQVRFKLPQTLEEALQVAVVVFEAEAQEKRNETFYANSENHTKNGSTSSGKFGHPDQESRDNVRTGNRSKSTNYRPVGRQPTQHMRRTSVRSRQDNRPVRCYNCNKLGHYAKHCYQAKANGNNNERQSNPPGRQTAEVPQTNSNAPRRNNHPQGNEH